MVLVLNMTLMEISLSKEVLGMTDTMDGEGLIAILDSFETDFMTDMEFTQLRKCIIKDFSTVDFSEERGSILEVRT